MPEALKALLVEISGKNETGWRKAALASPYHCIDKGESICKAVHRIRFLYHQAHPQNPSAAF